MHAANIQGNPWQPCPQCPRRLENGGNGSEGVCPSRRHAAFCGHAASSWIKWRDVIREQPSEDRPARIVAVAEKPSIKPATLPTQPPRPELRRQLASYRAGRGCFYRTPCGCVSAQCWWKDRRVGLDECGACQTEHVLTPEQSEPLPHR